MAVNKSANVYGGSPFEENLGDRIRELREKHGETQDDLAKALNLEQRVTVMYWENGQRKIKAKQLFEIAEHYHVSADYLLGLSPDETPDKDTKFICDTLGISKKSIENLSLAYINNLAFAKDALKPLLEEDYLCTICRIGKYFLTSDEDKVEMYDGSFLSEADIQLCTIERDLSELRKKVQAEQKKRKPIITKLYTNPFEENTEKVDN